MADFHVTKRGQARAEVKNWEDVDAALVDMTGIEPRLKGDEYIHFCPFCDKPDHLYVNYTKGVYNCYRCGGDDPMGRGNIFKLAEYVGVTPETDDLDLSAGVTTEKLDQDLSAIYIAGEGVLDTNQAPQHDPNDLPVNPPPEFTPINLDTWYLPEVQRAVAYLHYRGLNGSHINSYRLSICRWYGETQVVFPDFNRYGQLRWWQRRGIMPSSTGAKYVGPTGDKAGKIGNWYQAIQQPAWYVGVCEGPISGMIAGPEFTWLWGKEHSPQQLEVLASCGKPVVIALDGEAKAFKNAIGLATDIRSRGQKSIIVPIPGEHDPASLGHSEFQKVLLKSLILKDQSDLDFLERVVNDYV